MNKNVRVMSGIKEDINQEDCAVGDLTGEGQLLFWIGKKSGGGSGGRLMEENNQEDLNIFFD